MPITRLPLSWSLARADFFRRNGIGKALHLLDDLLGHGHRTFLASAGIHRPVAAVAVRRDKRIDGIGIALLFANLLEQAGTDA